VQSVRLAVLVPVKRFTAAKGRLAGVLSDGDRARLAEWMASGVLDTVAEVPTFVACDDEHVAAWATRMGAQVIWGAGLGLNGAVDDGVGHIASNGYECSSATPTSHCPAPCSTWHVSTASRWCPIDVTTART